MTQWQKMCLKSQLKSDVSNMGNSDVEMVTEEEKNPEGPCDINRTPAKEGKPSCPFCDSEFEQDISLKFHVNGSHQNELQGIEPLDLNEDESSCVCPMCEENFPQSEISLFEAHVHSHFTASATPADSLYQQQMKRREEQAAKFKAQRNLITQEGSPSVSSSGSSNKKQSSSDSSSKITTNKLGVSKNSPNGTVNNKSGASKSTPGGTSLYKKQALKNMESAVARGQMSISDFYTQKEELSLANSSGVDEGATCTKGVMPKLEQFLGKQSGRYLVKYWLASPTDHYAASYGDKGWGCGYRNLQMLLSYVMKIPVFQQPVFNSTLKIPSIPKLQQLIEAAWSQGFDPQGKEQLQKLVHTRKWIGATEICAVLSSLKVKCRLIDFHCPTGPGNTHPRLFEWVKSFYSSSSEFKPPLYLQHQGHSRTIIGIEENKDGSLKLLIFDPSTPKPQMTRFAIGDIDNNKMKGLRRTLHGLKARQYQIVAIQGLLTDAEQKRSKLLRSERIP